MKRITSEKLKLQENKLKNISDLILFNKIIHKMCESLQGTVWLNHPEEMKK